MKAAGMALAANTVHAQSKGTVERPNIILVLADQRHYGLSKGTGYPLDTSPTLDHLQRQGCGFRKNYCTSPICVPSRISMLTGRWPEAHRVRMNLAERDAFFEKDLYQVAKSRGYRTGLSGKNHTYLKATDLDFWKEFDHNRGYMAPDAAPGSKEFEAWLQSLHFNMATEPSPYSLETQLPYRIVSEAIRFIDESASTPFLLQVSFPDPHDPEQVPAPYWNMFPPEAVPDRAVGPEALQKMGYRAQWEYRLQQDNFPETEKQWRRYVSNYLGALRMLDDQIKRLVEHVDRRGLTQNTVLLFTSDHGDYLMNYGLGRKGVGLYEDLTHTPLIWWGYGIHPSSDAENVFTSMADVMPTLCEAMGAEIPHGVQGRSLWPLLNGSGFPEQEFRSIYSGVGLGGLYYEAEDEIPTSVASNGNHDGGWDELNRVTQSGNQKMIRMGDWKLVYDMMGYGALYNLASDPLELKNLYGKQELTQIQEKLMSELAMWLIRTQDSLPTGPQNGHYQTKWPNRHNWYAPYRRQGSATPYMP